MGQYPLEFDVGDGSLDGIPDLAQGLGGLLLGLGGLTVGWFLVGSEKPVISQGLLCFFCA